jgi:thiamine pyrophosphokinase
MTNPLDHRALIFTGGTLGQWALAPIQSTDYLIGADRGADFLIRHGYVPHLALGDFDSVEPDQMKQITNTAIELLTFDALDKDWTDTELALREAIARGYRSIVLLGALGTRFDHSLGNVHLLRQAIEQECKLTIMDEHNEITLCMDHCFIQANDRFPNTSLLPLSASVTGVTLQGFRYPLKDATLKLGQTIGISNVLEAEEGSITLISGMLLIIRSRD